MNSHTGYQCGSFSALIASLYQCSHASSVRRGQNQNENSRKQKKFGVPFNPTCPSASKASCGCELSCKQLSRQAEFIPVALDVEGEKEVLGLQGSERLLIIDCCVPR